MSVGAYSVVGIGPDLSRRKILAAETGAYSITGVAPTFVYVPISHTPPDPYIPGRTDQADQAIGRIDDQQRFLATLDAQNSFFLKPDGTAEIAVNRPDSGGDYSPKR